MKKVLYLVMAVALVITVGCQEDAAPLAPTPITINNTLTNTNNASGGSEPTLPEDTSNNLVTLDPNAIEIEFDRRAAVTVTVTTPAGNTVSPGNIEATSLDPTVAILSEVIGDRVFFRGTGTGETTVIVHAGGSSAQLAVTVVPQS